MIGRSIGYQMSERNLIEHETNLWHQSNVKVVILDTLNDN